MMITSSHCFIRQLTWLAATVLIGCSLPTTVYSQAVCLPAPRLLTTVPMGGQRGQTLDVKIAGDNLDDIRSLHFSHNGITATPKLNATGQPIANLFEVSIADDCPAGIHEARVLTRLGISSSRAFNVGQLPESQVTKPNTSLEKAFPLQIDSICNAAMTKQTVDFYTINAQKDQRLIIDCAARGIDSKLRPVLILADATGADIQVERRGGAIDFTAPTSGRYVVKVHDLTYNGGPHYFYRLSVRDLPAGQAIVRPPSTRTVSAFSWPPHGLKEAELAESEPNNGHANAQKISLPCDIRGNFFPAADVDTFEFNAKKGDVWWVEVASARLGRPTDPAIVVQHITKNGADEKPVDLVELSDIASPVKVSSNGYSYDGPPYNAGSTDVLGKIEIKADGIHRLHLRDLFGGTRRDPANIWRMIIRKAQPDFAVVSWALHMNLRNGDRNALSKPIALRGGATMPLEVVVLRRDDFNGEIQLEMANLPDGVTSTGLTIPANESRGIMLISAEQNAPAGLTVAEFTATGNINNQKVTRKCHLASMAWPVPNAWSEIPAPRLLADVPISVCDSEFAPITISPREDKVYTASTGEKLTIPLTHVRRSEFSGANISLKTFGTGFEKAPAFNATLKGDESKAVLDLAKLKTKPGDYTIAFYGSAVTRYRYNFAKIAEYESKLQEMQKKTAALKKDVDKNRADTEALAADKKKKQAQLTKMTADIKSMQKQLKQITAKAKPKDIVDIVVSQPVKIRVEAAEEPKK